MSNTKPTTKTHTILGVCIILLGIFAIYSPFMTGVVFSEILSFTLIIASVAAFISAFQAPTIGRKIFQIIAALIAFVASVFLFLTPVASMASITLICISFLFVDGLFGLYGAYQYRKQNGAGMVLINALSSLILAALLISDWPLSGLYAIGVFIGIKMIFAGFTLITVGAVKSKLVEELNIEAGNKA